MHALPAIEDAVQQLPDVSFDWVVDESFAEVPLWHSAVNRVIKTAHRRWKKSLRLSWQNKELQTFHGELKKDTYDVVLDLQGSLKSAFVSWLTKQPTHGYDKNSCREKPAHWFYQTCHSVEVQQHAVERMRQLMAMALGYSKPDSKPQYGVNLSSYALPDLSLPENYVFFVHNASKVDKMWSVECWQGLLAKVTAAGYFVLLPCGSTAEHERAKMIAADNTMAQALPKMSLDAMAAIISRAKAAVCSDTGLAHMAAVAGTPAITLYAVTDIRLIGTEGENQQHIVADKSMDEITVDQVWQQLTPLLS